MQLLHELVDGAVFPFARSRSQRKRRGFRSSDRRASTIACDSGACWRQPVTLSRSERRAARFRTRASRGTRCAFHLRTRQTMLADFGITSVGARRAGSRSQHHVSVVPPCAAAPANAAACPAELPGRRRSLGLGYGTNDVIKTYNQAIPAWCSNAPWLVSMSPSSTCILGSTHRRCLARTRFIRTLPATRSWRPAGTRRSRTCCRSDARVRTFILRAGACAATCPLRERLGLEAVPGRVGEFGRSVRVDSEVSPAGGRTQTHFGPALAH